MKTLLSCGLAVLVLSAAALPARAQTYMDVEAARANARAGGPTNAYDAELLNRYGALSGTPGYSPGGMYKVREEQPRRRRRRD
jgi:opacity protein-like surface antigen